MPSRDLDARCSRYFTYRDLIECGETWVRLEHEGRPEANVPRSAATWRWIERLARTVLDPVHEHFGSIDVTYCFASPALVRHIPQRISPALDQHAGSEINARRSLVCERRGQAVDFRVRGASSIDVALWIRSNLAFDRMYIYGASRPLHVSQGPARSAAVIAMVRRGERLLPRRASDLSAAELIALLGSD